MTFRIPCFFALAVLAASGAACGSTEGPPDPLDGLTVVREDPSDLPLRGATEEELERFAQGDALFDAAFRESQGLGPLYIRVACSSCHAADGRGPGFVEKMMVVGADGYTPAADVIPTV